jgi:ABC-type Mn2+/Zn2+ transport system ATPase subunit
MTPYHSNSPINIKGLSVSYDRKRVLTNIYLKVPAGSIVGVIGPNGAGKSTLFKAILGLIDNNVGDIKVHGQDIEEVRKRVAYVPQKDDVDWTFPATVTDIVRMGRYPHKGMFQSLNKKDFEIADQAMSDLSILDLKNRQIGELSGGQQQRVFIARALAQEADLFFLDEPFVGVDMLTEDKIIELLKRLREENKTTLVVHHDLSTVEEYFDHVILLNQRLVAFGKTEEVFTSENVNRTYGAQLNILHKSSIEK